MQYCSLTWNIILRRWSIPDMINKSKWFWMQILLRFWFFLSASFVFILLGLKFLMFLFLIKLIRKKQTLHLLIKFRLNFAWQILNTRLVYLFLVSFFIITTIEWWHTVLWALLKYKQRTNKEKVEMIANWLFLCKQISTESILIR